MSLIMLYVFYWIMAAIGLTIGYHRCLSHNELKLNPILEINDYEKCLKNYSIKSFLYKISTQFTLLS